MELNQEIRDITKAIQAAVPVERIYLFGSYAYGTPTKDSDYDFFIVIPNGGVRPLDAMRAAYRSLRDVRRRTPVDILADYEENFEQRKRKNTLESKVANEGMVLYERL